MDKCCKNCEYHDSFTWVCFCPDSENRADFTDDESVCDCWTEKDN